MTRDLSTYPIDAVAAALTRCRKELKRIALVDILERIPGGHPGPEEAWALVSRALNDENVSLVWTDPMREAFGVALGLQDDAVAARMAFKEVYARLVSEARAANVKPAWGVSLGHDKSGRELALLDAVAKGRVTAEHAQLLLPHHHDDVALSARLLEASKVAFKPMLEAPRG